MDIKKYLTRSLEYNSHLIQLKILRQIMSAPFIYMMIIPLIITDFFLEIYHHICFPLYEIPIVKRSNYIKLDRHRLSYLNWFEKLNCTYCGYANGLISYLTKITGETEKYWCAIKHQKTPNYHEPKHHRDFLEYGDEEQYQNKYSNK